jgi:Tol biopolymer transport system component
MSMAGFRRKRSRAHPSGRAKSIALLPTVLTCVSLLVLGTPPTARATFPGSNGRIAFSYGDQFPFGDLGLHTDIYTVRPDGSHLRQLTHVADDAAAALPSWSPDGTKIVYESNVSGNYEIWVMDADGGHKTRITREPHFEHLTPSWSPDGTQIVYSRCDAPFGFIGFCDVQLMDADGGSAHRVVGGHRIHVRPVFSPDGTKIAFGSDRAGFLSAVWVVNADGTGLRRLTNPDTEGFWPDWSPDGERILFTDNCCRPHSNLWTVKSDGTGLARLTDSAAQHNLMFGSYSPSGTKMVLTSDEAYPRFCCTDLVVRGRSGGLRTVVERVPGLVIGSWQPVT